MTPTCRYCGKPISVPELTGDSAVERLAKSYMLNGSCNRCADYHRGQEDRLKAVEALAFSKTGGDAAVLLSQLISRISQRAQDHYKRDQAAGDAFCVAAARNPMAIRHCLDALTNKIRRQPALQL